MPAYRFTNWSESGNNGYARTYARLIDVKLYGAVGNGVYIDDTAVLKALDTLNFYGGGVLYFPAGNYVLKRPLTLLSDITLRGAGADQTTLRFNLGGNGNLISTSGSTTGSWFNIIGSVVTGQNYLDIMGHNFSSGDWIRIAQNDSNFITSTWSSGYTGQLAKVDSVNGNRVYLHSAMRIFLSSTLSPKAIKVAVADSVGMEDFRIVRADATSAQTSNFNLNYTVNSWLYGVQSDSCNFAHISLSSCSNIYIFGCYLKEAFAYGGGGQGYGIAMQYTTGQCLVVNNIFNKLRHSILLQACANGNVLAYNYSLNPYWTSFPTNAGGDLLLHGNYPFFNLFEGNIAQNIVIDVSHGMNGPFNTYLRNRAELYGILMSSGSGDSLNFIGNEITGTGFGMGNFSLSGAGHFLYNNNAKGTYYPSGTTSLSDTSYFLTSKPTWWNITGNWPSIGGANTLNSGTNPAKHRYINASLKTVSLALGTSLPLHWGNFKAVRQGDKVSISWLTFSETNTKEFLIWQINGSGIIQHLGTLAAAGYSNNTRKYSFIDEYNNNETICYQIKQTDLNGTFTFSPLITISQSREIRDLVKINPNPCQGNFKVHGLVKSAEMVIINTEGKVVYQKQLIADEPVTFELNTILTPGVYVLFLNNNEGVQRQKLIVQP